MVSSEKWAQISARLASLGMFDADLEEKFIRSRGHGGQNVNKVSTCVYLSHPPSGLSVKCQETRSQIDNRYFARVWLADKMEALKKGVQSAKAKEIHKLRKQKQKRSKRAKEKLLENKRKRSLQKISRKNPDWE